MYIPKLATFSINTTRRGSATAASNRATPSVDPPLDRILNSCSFPAWTTPAQHRDCFLQMSFHLLRRTNQQLITHMRLGRIDRMWRQCQNTRTLQADGRNPERAQVFDQVDYAILSVQIDQVDGSQ